jgi:hypothetical protein
VCGLSDQTDKVSSLYVMGIAGNKLAPAEGEPQTTPLNLTDIPPQELRELGKRLKPPASPKKAPTRPLHPDLVVVTFSLIIPLFLYRIYQNQASVLPVVLAVLAVLYVLYIWQRKKIIARFERQVQANKAADERIRMGIERWMRLYYCRRDDIVFEPGGSGTAPAGEMMAFLMTADGRQPTADGSTLTKDR